MAAATATVLLDMLLVFQLRFEGVGRTAATHAAARLFSLQIDTTDKSSQSD